MIITFMVGTKYGTVSVMLMIMQANERREFQRKSQHLLLLCCFSTLNLLGATELSTGSSISEPSRQVKSDIPSFLCSYALSVVYARLYRSWYQDQTNDMDTIRRTVKELNELS